MWALIWNFSCFVQFPSLLFSINKHKHTDHMWLLSKSWPSGFYGHLFNTHTVKHFFFPTSSSFHYNLTGKKYHAVTIPNPCGSASLCSVNRMWWNHSPSQRPFEAELQTHHTNLPHCPPLLLRQIIIFHLIKICALTGMRPQSKSSPIWLLIAEAEIRSKWKSKRRNKMKEHIATSVYWWVF